MRLRAQWSEWKFRVAKGYWCDHFQYKAPPHWTMGVRAREPLMKVATWELGDLGRADGWHMADVGRKQVRFCWQCGYMQTR